MLLIHTCIYDFAKVFRRERKVYPCCLGDSLLTYFCVDFTVKTEKPFPRSIHFVSINILSLNNINV